MKTDADILAYLKSLRAGEQVIETGESGMHLVRGVVYLSADHKDDEGNPLVCVRWTLPDGETMGTSVTWGTRRVSDYEAESI